MRRIFKLVFLFVGVVIGAGFATGSEIVLYFKNSGYISVVISGIIMGLLSIAFCYFGKLQSKYKIMKNLTKIVVFLSSIITYCIMISGTSELMYNQFGGKDFGIITGFVVAIIMLYDIRIIKILNLIIVPLIVLIMLVILIIGGGELYSGFDFSSSLKYAGMNMLLGGYFMSEEGCDLSHRRIGRFRYDTFNEYLLCNKHAIACGGYACIRGCKELRFGCTCRHCRISCNFYYSYRLGKSVCRYDFKIFAA